MEGVPRTLDDLTEPMTICDILSLVYYINHKTHLLMFSEPEFFRPAQEQFAMHPGKKLDNFLLLDKLLRQYYQEVNYHLNDIHLAFRSIDQTAILDQ